MVEFEEVTIKPKYAIRVRDLEEWHAIRCKCFKCDHIGYVDPQTLREKHPPHTTVKDFEHFFKCEKCGFKGHNTWTTVQEVEPS